MEEIKKEILNERERKGKKERKEREFMCGDDNCQRQFFYLTDKFTTICIDK